MPSASPQTIKLKSTLRLLIPRLRMAQKKDTALSITQRREMADLLSQSREASARIRVENIIHTDITVELMEILELYAELLLARAGLLDVRDKEKAESGGSSIVMESESTGLEEAAASMIYAAPRLPREVRELGLVRALLVERFGRDFAAKAGENKDGIVPARVVDKLKVDPPKEALVTAYLEEIARTYGVDWPRRREEVDDLQRQVDDEDASDGEGGGMKEEPLLAAGAGAPAAVTPQKKLDLGRPFERDELSRATPPRNLAPKSPVSVAPPGARSDNLAPRVKLPGGEAVDKKPAAAAGKNIVGGTVPTVDDLAKRFQMLKR